MELFDYLIEKRKSISKGQHPFVHTEEYFRKVYAFGIGVLAMGHMNAIEEIKDPFNDFLFTIGLPASYSDNILIELNNNFDFRINDVFSKLDNKQKQYCFFLDLYLVSKNAKWSREYADSIIHYYAQAFRFSKKEEDFFKSFMQCAKNEDSDGAVPIYEKFLAQGHIISYRFLTYAFPSFKASVKYDGLKLKQGQQVIIDRPAYIRDSIEVSDSSFLSIDGADIVLEGGILVNGGKLQIKDSSIQVREPLYDYAVYVKNTAGVVACGLNMDTGGQAGFWHQQQGTLILENCSFSNSGKSPGIYFSGRNLTVEDCSFLNCDNGGILSTGIAQSTITDSKFVNCCAENGGGFFCDSMKDTSIRNCTFENCRAKYNGSAVYFKNQKFGQMVKDCETINCAPSGSIIFNAFSREVLR